MALGYEIGTIMKRSSTLHSDDTLTIKTDDIEGMDQAFTQVLTALLHPACIPRNLGTHRPSWSNGAASIRRNPSFDLSIDEISTSAWQAHQELLLPKPWHVRPDKVQIGSLAMRTL